LYTHRFEQQLRAPENEQELPTVTQAPEPSQRCVVVSQWLLQHSLLTLQRSPSARQAVWKKHRPPTQSRLQQLPFELQLSPSVAQPPVMVERQEPPEQLLSQHSALVVQAVPSTLHSVPVPQWPVGSQ
jgi:hypothetical protein